MLPRNPRSTLSAAISWIEAEETFSRPYSPTPQDQQATKLNKLGSRLVALADALDITVVGHSIDPGTGVGAWEAECRCRHCGCCDIAWPPTPEDISGRPDVGSNIDPFLAEAMCNGCYRYLGSAVALRGLCSWLAVFKARSIV